MITVILSARTTPRRPRAEAMRHLKSIHGPMVYAAPADAGDMPSAYVQNHVVDDLPLPAALEAWRWDRHLVTEISFTDLTHLTASTTTPYYLTRLKPDEPRFVDQTSVRPTVVTRSLSDDSRGAVWKLFVYLAASDATDGFADAWGAAGDLATPFCVAQSRRSPIAAPTAPSAAFDGVWTLWFDTAGDAREFARNHLEPALKPFADTLDETRCRLVFAEQFDVPRLLAENASSLTGAAS
ncbi:EthD domain-containing protein [Brevundimonas sp.]|uniref:EthD domain-containing protein n=1 Tax=Brevundimonas sp. TaxID=1871086 RepID=UPI003D0BCDA1